MGKVEQKFDKRSQHGSDASLPYLALFDLIPETRFTPRTNRGVPAARRA